MASADDNLFLKARIYNSSGEIIDSFGGEGGGGATEATLELIRLLTVDIDSNVNGVETLLAAANVLYAAGLPSALVNNSLRTTLRDANGDAVTLATDPTKSDDAAFTPGTDKVQPVGYLADESSPDSVDEGDIGAPRMTLARKPYSVPQAHTAGGATPHSLLSAATTNATVVKASAGQVYAIQAFTIDATPVYLKLYNKATAPDENDTPVGRYLIPGSADGRGFMLEIPTGLEFSAGISYRLTTAIADNSTAAVAAAEVLVNIDWK